MSLLKPQPPPRAPAGPSSARSKLGPHAHAAAAAAAGAGGFELLLQELQLNRLARGGADGLPAGGGTRSRTNSRGPATARAPSSGPHPPPRVPFADRTNLATVKRDASKPPLTAREPLARSSARADGDKPSGPTTPRGAATASVGSSWQEALAQRASFLSSFEAREIQNYETVYYCGDRCPRKIHGAELAGTNNHGYDDAQGDFKVVMDDHIAYRYQVLSALGRGSFGQVSKALDHKTQQLVALKIIKNKKKFHEQALIEVKVLRHLNAKDTDGASNVVRMLESFKFRNHVVIAFELHGQSLYDLHKAHRFAPMTEAAIRSFAKQMLQTLVLTHRERVVHCDLKPENVLLVGGSKTRINVIDFGSACFESERLYTYIQSRFYRAPEVLLGIPYTPAIDVWSLGCMLAEFSNGFPLFPGESEVQQMLLIMETLGLPPRSMLDRSPRKRVFFDAANAPKLVPNSKGKTPRPCTKALASFVQCANPDFLDLLQGMLAYEPEQRLTPSQALRHRFFGMDAPASSEPATMLPRLQPSKRR